jgi:hypothetical protein
VSQFLEELHALRREELAAIVTRGVQEGAFTPPADTDDFTLRFAALLDGFAILRIRHQPSRKRLTELAMTTARAELARDTTAAPAGSDAAPAD